MQKNIIDALRSFYFLLFRTQTLWRIYNAGDDRQ